MIRTRLKRLADHDLIAIVKAQELCSYVMVMTENSPKNIDITINSSIVGLHVDVVNF